jgi:hypothetical protein
MLEAKVFRYGNYTTESNRWLIFYSDEFVLGVLQQYTIVRLGGVEDDAMGKLSRVLNSGVASYTGLNDGSLEVVVLKEYVPSFVNTARRTFPHSFVDLDHDPFQLTEVDIEYCHSFDGRLEDVMKCASEKGAAFYMGLKRFGLPQDDQIGHHP